MSEPTVSVSPPPDSSVDPLVLSVLSSLVVLLELLLPPPQPATTSAATASKRAAKSAAGRILVIEFCLRSGIDERQHMAGPSPCSSSGGKFGRSGASPTAIRRRNCTVGSMTVPLAELDSLRAKVWG